MFSGGACPLAQCESTSLQGYLNAWNVILNLGKDSFYKKFDELWSDTFLLVETEVKTLSMATKINAFTLSKKI